MRMIYGAIVAAAIAMVSSTSAAASCVDSSTDSVPRYGADKPAISVLVETVSEAVMDLVETAADIEGMYAG